MRGWWLPWMFVAATASAAPLPARLEHRREGAGTACAGEEALRRAVNARLGVDSFRDDAPRTLRVRVGGKPDDLHATLVMIKDGRSAKRTLRARTCAELQAAVELAVSLAIDPMWEPPAAEPEIEPEIEIVEGEAAPAAAPRPKLEEYILVDEEPVVEKRGEPGPWHVGIGSYATLFTSPELIVSMRLELGLRLPPWSVVVEPWLTLPASTSSPGGFVTLSTVAASLLLCREVGPVNVCAEGVSGALQAIGDGEGFVLKERAWSPFAAVGGRVLRAWTLYRGLGVRVAADLVVPVVRTRLHARSSNGNIEVWSSPYTLPSVGVAFVGHFP